MRTGRPLRRCRKTSASSIPVSRRPGISQEKWPLTGPFSCHVSIFVMTLLDDHHLVGVVMTPAAMHAEVPMFAELGTRTKKMMLVGTALDHDGLGARNRRRRNSDNAKGSKNVSKLLHVVLLHLVRINVAAERNVPGEPKENSERLFSLIKACHPCQHHSTKRFK